ncbi:uncharacterized protein KRP23_345 [Phytophthora ramorum]|uniref:uncharacterized protein n=1 Tax=Phytophthora ramorum TaxID=164328 RepID=UPI0030B1C0A0|nr:hypothetical protein KRP23_345 [Phytophthora ramorum]
MPKDRFISANPYPNVHVSEEERQQLIELVDGFVQDYFQKYQDFVVVDKHTVDERRWAHVKSKDNLHIYTERSVKELARKGLVAKNVSNTELSDDNTAPDKELPVMLSTAPNMVTRSQDNTS